jgi:hypothetical protein
VVISAGSAGVRCQGRAELVEPVLPARLRRPNRQSVNSFPLSIARQGIAQQYPERGVRMVRMRSEQARSRSRRKPRIGRCLAVVDRKRRARLVDYADF